MRRKISLVLGVDARVRVVHRVRQHAGLVRIVGVRAERIRGPGGDAAAVGARGRVAEAARRRDRGLWLGRDGVRGARVDGLTDDIRRLARGFEPARDDRRRDGNSTSDEDRRPRPLQSVATLKITGW